VAGGGAADRTDDESDLGEFPPLDVCITGGIHVWNDAGRCSRCDNWKGNT
jgi:hypothetical protein